MSGAATTAVEARHGAATAGRARRSLVRLPMIVVAVSLWELTARSAASVFFPPPSRIGQRFASDWLSGSPSGLFLSDAFVTNALPTILRLLAGWTIGALCGVGIGVLIASLPRVGAMAEPLVRLGMSVPAPALLPLAIVFFGLDNGGKIFFIAFGAVWPVIISTTIGLRNADRTALASASSLVLPAWTWFTRVRLPLASPQIMSGLRVSVNAAVLLIIVAELYGATSGIGFFIVSTQRNFDTVGTWSGIVLLALLGITCNGLFALVQDRVMHWHIRPREAQK